MNRRWRTRYKAHVWSLFITWLAATFLGEFHVLMHFDIVLQKQPVITRKLRDKWSVLLDRWRSYINLWQSKIESLSTCPILTWKLWSGIENTCQMLRKDFDPPIRLHFLMATTYSDMIKASATALESINHLSQDMIRCS